MIIVQKLCLLWMLFAYNARKTITVGNPLSDATKAGLCLYIVTI